ncbi:sulfotransferase 2B1-like [Pagrus major]|uniref:sulfotransferase 2B1-like n=1 Tax=Pagrus major TaxID=143350 RepID=UPI003CC87C96
MTEAELFFVYKGIYALQGWHTPETLKYFEEFSFRPDDIIIATYPKSGTTWSQEIVPLIVSGGDPTCLQSPNYERVPWLEECQRFSLNLEERPSPRLFATHVQYNMMPPSFFQVRPRVINVMRNPKDVFTSAFHYYEKASYHLNPGPQNEFLHKFLDGKVIYGSWFDHVKSWLNAEDKEHMMHISYEEMIMDLKDSVSRIAQFLEIPLDDEVIKNIADQCLFKNMRTNSSNLTMVPPEMNGVSKSEFMRKGIAGDWKNQLTVAEAEHFDAVYKDQMKDVKYKFAWD